MVTSSSPLQLPMQTACTIWVGVGLAVRADACVGVSVTVGVAVGGPGGVGVSVTVAVEV